MQPSIISLGNGPSIGGHTDKLGANAKDANAKGANAKDADAKGADAKGAIEKSTAVKVAIADNAQTSGTHEPGASLVESLRASGFAIIRHHGIATQAIEELLAAWSDFFTDQARFDYSADPVTQDGYFSYELAETAKGSRLPDIKEYFHFRPGCRMPARLEAVTRTYFDTVFALGKTLHGWIEQHTDPSLWHCLDSPLPECLSQQHSLCRILNYPALTGNEQAGAIRAAEHEDINFLTLLPAATTRGLEIKLDGFGWVPVEAEPGDFIVNVGDMLQELTDGTLPSTTHRVVNPEGSDNSRRMTAPVFIHPQRSLQLSSRYTAASYLAERLDEITRPALKHRCARN